MAIDKLGLYNIAMLALGERRLDQLTEDRPERYDLDEVYVRGNGAIYALLEQGHWNFAMRAVQIDKSTSVTPSFGFANAFDKPTDFVRLNMISADERFNDPLNNYEFEGDYIYSDVDPIYIRYVSDDGSWGADFAKWPDTFSLWAGHWLATQIAARTKSDGGVVTALEKKTNKLLIDARSKDVSQEPQRWPPLSSWARSRLGRVGYDRGQRGTLIGR